MNIYTILDTKSKGYGLPFYAKNDATVIRTIKNSMISQQSEYSMNPEDFILFKIGTYDQDSGVLEVTPHETVSKLIDISMMVEKN